MLALLERWLPSCAREGEGAIVLRRVLMVMQERERRMRVGEVQERVQERGETTKEDEERAEASGAS